MKTISMKELVKDKEWQKVRESLVGKWNLEPEKCCRKLRDYLGPIKETTEKKLRIVMNYLTGSGFRLGKINHECISKLRAEISSEMKIRKYRK